MRTGLWDRQGANIASRYKEMYGVELFLRLKPVSLDRECLLKLIKTKKLKWANPPTCIPKFALYISRPFLHVDHCVNSVNINFTLNLTQGVFIDRIYRINHTETWNFNAPTLVTSVSHKITAKCGILCPKTLLLTEKQLHTIHFFVATCNVCPLAIP